MANLMAPGRIAVRRLFFLGSILVAPPAGGAAFSLHLQPESCEAAEPPLVCGVVTTPPRSLQSEPHRAETYSIKLKRTIRIKDGRMSNDKLGSSADQPTRVHVLPVGKEKDGEIYEGWPCRGCGYFIAI